MTRQRPTCPHCKLPMQSYLEIIVGGRTVVEVEYLDDLSGNVRESVVELVDADAGPERPIITYRCGNCGEWLAGKPEMPEENAMTDSAQVMATDAAEFASTNPRAWAYLRLVWWLVSDCRSEIHLDLHQGTTPIEVVGYDKGRRTNVLYVGETDHLPTAGEIETAIMKMVGPECTLPEWFTAEWKAAVGFHRQMG